MDVAEGDVGARPHPPLQLGQQVGVVGHRVVIQLSQPAHRQELCQHFNFDGSLLHILLLFKKAVKVFLNLKSSFLLPSMSKFVALCIENPFMTRSWTKASLSIRSACAISVLSCSGGGARPRCR